MLDLDAEPAPGGEIGITRGAGRCGAEPETSRTYGF